MEGLNNYEKPDNRLLTQKKVSEILEEFNGEVWEDGEYFAFKTDKGEGRVHKWVSIPKKVNGEGNKEVVVGVPIEDFLRGELSESEKEEE